MGRNSDPAAERRTVRFHQKYHPPASTATFSILRKSLTCSIPAPSPNRQGRGDRAHSGRQRDGTVGSERQAELRDRSVQRRDRAVAGPGCRQFWVGSCQARRQTAPQTAPRVCVSWVGGRGSGVLVGWRGDVWGGREGIHAKRSRIGGGWMDGWMIGRLGGWWVGWEVQMPMLQQRVGTGH